MTKEQERREFRAIMKREIPTIKRGVASRLIELAAKHHRLAEAECNGDWPADNGERVVVACSRCEAGYVPSVVKSGLCPSCRTEDRVRAILADYPGVEPVFQGDPRGATIKIKVPSGFTNDWGQTGICVAI